MVTGSDPFADLLTLQRDMDRIMTRFGGRPRHAGEDGHEFWMPPVDVFKQGNDMVVRVEVPGVNPSEINVAVTGNMLTIKGERRQDQNRGEGDYVMRESTYGAFERRITMPEDIDASQVHAQYRAGVLEVTVPGSALISPQPQQVRVAGAQPQAMGGQPQQQPSMGAQPQQGGYGQAGQYQQPQQPPRDEYAEELARYGQGPQGRAQGEQQGAPAGQQQPQVGVQGGWVMPQQPQQPEGGRMQEMRPYPTEQGQREGEQPREEPKRRSRLGEWFHADES